MRTDAFEWLLNMVGWLMAIGGLIAIVIGAFKMFSSDSSGY